ncbi:MAG TPA: response regulator [Polyangiaceae bacterium]|nr:response regulator [Polyangiaceae bacterium]
MGQLTSPLAHPAEPAGSSRVLLVDDQPEVRRVVRRSLAKAGYEVVEARNGRIAVELARESTFDLVISDVRMPDMSGLELLSALHAHDPDLPVVLTSGWPGPDGTLDADAVGAFAYLQKPVPFEVMREAVRGAVEQRRALLASREQFEPFVSMERLRVARKDDGDSDEPL